MFASDIKVEEVAFILPHINITSEDSEVSDSEEYHETELETEEESSAATFQFLAVDPEAQHMTGSVLKGFIKEEQQSEEPDPLYLGNRVSEVWEGKAVDTNLKKMLEVHRRSQETQVKVCPKCSSVLHIPAEDEALMRLPNFEKPFACQLCRKRFPKKHLLKKHAEKHSDELPSPYCPNCPRIGKPYACFLCPNRYPFISSLRRHIKGHVSVSRDYVCQYCDATFRTNYNLKEHMLIHTSTRQFSCEHCPAKFYKKTSLKNHVGIHEYKQFSKEQLEKEIQSKPFFCEICLARFTSISSKKRHQRNRSCDKPQSIRNVRPFPSLLTV